MDSSIHRQHDGVFRGARGSTSLQDIQQGLIQAWFLMLASQSGGFSETQAIHTPGGMRASTPPMRGGLAPWQLRRSTELLTANLDGSVTLQSLADACRLSTGHFIRAFRTSTGLAPFQWLAHRRVDAAKVLIRQRRASLGEIALACGFADQSHFTRIFSRIVGTSPGAWRRNLEE